VDSDANLSRVKAPIDLSVRCFQQRCYTYRRLFWHAPVVRRCVLENRSVGGLLMRIGDANFTQLKAPLDLSIRRFHRSFYTYRSPFWEAPVVRRCILENRRVRRLWTRIGTVDSDANSTGLKAPLFLSIRCFPRRLYTYRRPFLHAPVVRRCFLEKLRVRRLRKQIGTVDSNANFT
jgi:hypothetical protein